MRLLTGRPCPCPCPDLLRETEEKLSVAPTELKHALDNKRTMVEQMDHMVVEAWSSQLEYERQVPERDRHMSDVGGIARAVRGARFYDAHERLEVGGLGTHCSSACVRVCIELGGTPRPAASGQKGGLSRNI